MSTKPMYLSEFVHIMNKQVSVHKSWKKLFIAMIVYNSGLQNHAAIREFFLKYFDTEFLGSLAIKMSKVGTNGSLYIF